MKEEAEILARLIALEEKLNQYVNNPMNFQETSKYLGMAPSYLYKLTYQNIIPHYKPTGKRLYFFKKELDEWIIKGNGKCRIENGELKKQLEQDPNQMEMFNREKVKNKTENDDKEIVIDPSTSLGMTNEVNSKKEKVKSKTEDDDKRGRLR